MPSSDDITNLFSRFGGRPERYREIEREDEARDSEARWPLLSAIGHRIAQPVAGSTSPATARADANAPPQPVAAVAPTEAAPAVVPGSPGASLLDTIAATLARSSTGAPASPMPAPSTPAAAPAKGFQFIAPRPRGNLRPVNTAASTSLQPTEAAAQATATVGTAPLSGLPRQAPPPAAPPVAPLAASPFAGVGAVNAAQPAAVSGAAPAASGTSAGTRLESLFQRLSAPTSPASPTPAGSSFFTRLVGR